MRQQAHFNFLRIVFFTTVVCFLTGVASAQSPPTGPAGGDLSGTYPNPVLAADRVRKAGDTMTGLLNISQPNAGGLVYPFSLSTSGNAGPGRGVSFQFNLPANPLAALGAEMIVARESFGLPSYIAFSTHNGTAVSETVRIIGNGAVGIGKTAPAYKLDVNGEINATGLRINGTPISTGGSQWTGTTNIYFASGNVGVGTSNPITKFQVNKTIRIDDDSGSNVGSDTLGSAPSLYLGTTGGGNMFQFNANGGLDLWQFNSGWNRTISFLKNGYVGIGTTAPVLPLHINNSAGYAGLLISGNTLGVLDLQDTTAPANTKLYQLRSEAGLFRLALVNDAWTSLVQPNILVANAAGNVGIGTATPTEKLHVVGNGKVTGNLVVDGNIAAKYQDVAEWVDSSQDLTAGTVVVLDDTKINQVVASSKSYDTRVAGVISARPGLTLGEGGEGRVLVATTGRVKVKVDATKVPIQIGDLLVTSDEVGIAIKSQPVDVGGVQLHRPGTLIGKALEPLAKGKGEILVLLSLQ